MSNTEAKNLRALIDACGRDLELTTWTAEERRALKMKLRAAEFKLTEA